MKKIIYSLLFIISALCVSCSEDIPGANFKLYEVESLTATAGDTQVSLAWTLQENSSPNEFLLTWTSGSVGTEDGELILDAAARTATVDNLVNDAAYTFAIQPRYNAGLAGKVSQVCTPKNSRFPVTDLIAASGDQKVRLKWTKPGSSQFTAYKITANPGNIQVTLEDTSLENYVVENLTNDQEYTFGITCVYPNGTSDEVSVLATPGLVFPIVAPASELVLFESFAFEYNDMYFVMGEVESISWDFGDGQTSTALSPAHAFAATGEYEVTATVTYTDGTSESGSITVKVVAYKWNSIDLNFNSLTGYVKVSNPVFSPDGKTMYIPTSTPNGNLFAIDVASGKFKWAFSIPKLTYGGGALVAPDGTIYQCDTDGNVYAIQPNGTQKWHYKAEGAFGASPALSADGVFYCVSNAGNIYALNASSGAVVWSDKLNDVNTGSAVAIDKSGVIYVGTNAGIYAYNSTGTRKWSLEGINVTERGAFALDGDVLYATLKSKAGLVAVNMTAGTQKWIYPTTGGDTYLPVVDKNGTIYFTEKGSKTVYAVNPDGTEKWKANVGHDLNYSGAALSADGVLYVGSQKPDFKVFGLNTTNGNVVFEEPAGQQIMASVSIGPDRRLYVGTIGSDNIGSMKAYNIGKEAESGSWSMRGGDYGGTNRQK